MNREATDFVRNMTHQGRSCTNLVLNGFSKTAGTYNISAQFCIPSSGSSINAINPTVQVLTHGFGFDKTFVFDADAHVLSDFE